MLDARLGWGEGEKRTVLIVVIFGYNPAGAKRTEDGC